MNQFAVTTLVPDKVTEQLPEDVVVYDHGFSDTQVQKILSQKELISSRDLVANPVTSEEFKTVIVPFNRIHRTTQFNIIAETAAKKKAGTKAKRVVKSKATKKLTKKAIAARLNDIIFKQATGGSLGEEDQKFYNEHLGVDKL